MTYDEKTATFIKSVVQKYLTTEIIESVDNWFFVEQRRLAGQVVVSKIENWLYRHSIKGFKITLEEASNLLPYLKIELPYKDMFDPYYVYFDRDQTIKKYRLWLPYNWSTCLYKTHKKNDRIMEELQKEFTIEKLSLMLNYPFIMSDYSDGKWVFRECWNVT